MHFKQRVVRGRVSSEHIVQFFDALETRARSVAQFVADALASGDGVVVAATSAHWTAIAGELRLLKVDVEEPLNRGRLVVRDAHTILPALMQRGTPDPEVFEALLGRSVRELARVHGRVSAYGELVDVLAAQREFDAAIRLEELWNGLTEAVSLRLMCGYCAAHFVDGAESRLKRVCSVHTQVRAHRNDPLGTWLLGLADMPFEIQPIPAR